MSVLLTVDTLAVIASFVEYPFPPASMFFLCGAPALHLSQDLQVHITKIWFCKFPYWAVLDGVIANEHGVDHRTR
jgi:hypothetical protein